MSTASKVLTVLVLLATFGWIYLVTAIATVNRKYGERLEAETKAFEQKQTALYNASLELARVNREAEAAQDAFGRQLADLIARRDNAKTQLALAQEIQTRLTLDQELLRKAGEQSAINQEFRENELTQHQEDLQQIEEAAQAAQSRNEELRGELESQRNEFQQLLQSNLQAVGSNAISGN